MRKRLRITFATLVLLAATVSAADSQATFSVVYNFGSQLNDPIGPY